jgi:hypothetical protein
LEAIDWPVFVLLLVRALKDRHLYSKGFNLEGRVVCMDARWCTLSFYVFVYALAVGSRAIPVPVVLFWAKDGELVHFVLATFHVNSLC